MNLEHVIPEDVGMSAIKLERSMQYARRAGEEIGATGGAVVVIRRDKIAGEWYWGQRGPLDTRAWDVNTLIPLASVTKGITGTVLALLVEDGIVWLDHPASAYIPELRKEGKSRITIRHLATHSSGLPAGDQDFYQSYRDRQPGEHPQATFVRHALMRDLAYEPGTWHVYSDPGVCLLGEVIYSATGQRVHEIAQKRLFKPLGLRRIGWEFPAEIASDIGGWSYEDPPRAGTADARLDVSVFGGLISNARDLATFGLMLLHEGMLEGMRVISPLTVRMMTSCQYPLPARAKYSHRGLLWWIKAEPDTPEMGQLVPNGTYCHGGIAHSLLVIMPELDVVAVKLCNRRSNPPEWIYNRDYPVFMDLVAAAVTEF